MGYPCKSGKERERGEEGRKSGEHLLLLSWRGSLPVGLSTTSTGAPLLKATGVACLGSALEGTSLLKNSVLGKIAEIQQC